MPHLFEALPLRGVTLRNRIVVSPMCQYSSQDGFANDWHLVHLGSRAVGGAALVIAEASAVVPEGRITPVDLGIWSDAHVAPLARIFGFIAKQGALPGIQLAHAGRKASTNEPWNGGHPISIGEGGWSPIFAPSAIAFADRYAVPKAMSRGEIHAVTQAFAAAAQRAHAAGAKVVEIHAAHGYLLHEFLSPLSNQRDDEYGGGFDNRIRFVCEVIEAVRRAWPEDLPLFLRISATDWVEGGWTPGDSVDLARRVKNIGVDLVDCSSGGNVPKADIPVGAGYQVEFARRIRTESGVATGAVGMITDPMQADQIVRNGEADVILMARQMLREPYFPFHAAPSLHQQAPWPVQYERAKPR